MELRVDIDGATYTAQRAMIDVLAPDDIEVLVSADGKTIWVNGPQGCLLRACRIAGKVSLQDHRQNQPEETVEAE